MEVYGSTESLGPQMQGRWVPGSNRLGTVGKVDPSIAEGRVGVSEMKMVDDETMFIAAVQIEREK